MGWDGEHLHTASASELRDTIGQLHAAEMLIHSKRLETQTVYEQQEFYREDGASCMSTWLGAELGMHAYTAREEVRVANVLQDLPGIVEVFEAGRLSLDKLQAVTRFATPETDQEWAVEAQRSSAYALRLHARRVQGRSTEEAEDAYEQRYLRSRKSQDGQITNIYAGLPTEDAASVLQTLTREANRQPKNPETGRQDHHERRMADALINLAASGVAQDPDPDRATIVIHVSEDKLFPEPASSYTEEPNQENHAGEPASLEPTEPGTSPQNGSSGPFAHVDEDLARPSYRTVTAAFAGPGFAELEDGTQIAVETAKRLLCDGRIEFAIRTRDGRTVGIGRASRQVPAWLERQVIQRDQHCQVPGCETSYLLHCHHLVPWDEFGPTNLDNLAAVCAYHHRWLHKKGYRMVRNPDGTHSLIKPGRGCMFRGPPILRNEIRDRVFDMVGRDSHGARSP